MGSSAHVLAAFRSENGVKTVTHRVLTAEPGHLFANELSDVTFLLEQTLQLGVLVLKVLHFQLHALRLALKAFSLLPLVVLQDSAGKGEQTSSPGSPICVTGMDCDGCVRAGEKPGSFL